jgi:WhiB family transcriptional regulator, redox-sensing transcriptional regulator
MSVTDQAWWLVKEFTSRTTVWPHRVLTIAIDKELYAVDWRHRAECLDEDPELFFPIGNTGPALLQIEEAKAVCRRCEVREQCLAWALEAGQDHGVWGGLSEDERRALKRRNARAKVRTA